MTKKKLKKEVKDLRNLEDNWDAYSAYPITKVSIEGANYIIDLVPRESLSANPCVVPLNDGSINLEFAKDSKELELETDGEQIIYLKCEKVKDKDELCEEGYLQFDDKEFLKKFYKFFEWLGVKRYPCPKCNIGETYDANAGGMFCSDIRCDNPECNYSYSDL